MQTKHLDLKHLNLSHADYSDLYEITGSIISIFVHALNHPLTGVQGYIYLINNYSSQIDKEELNDYLNRIKEQINRVSLMFTFYHSTFRSVEKIQKVFVAKPFDLIELIKKICNDVKIDIDSNSEKSLEILYPENILFGLLFELVKNAEKAIDEKANVLIKWFVDNNRFICEVHDNGKGISPNLTDSVKTLDLLNINKSGLGVVQAIIHISKGHLFFSKSPLLSGTLVRFEFPIKACYTNGEINEFK